MHNPFRIKRLDRFMLQSFLPLFVMTFFICLFIVLMQFLWRYIDDLVGKGLSIDVIAELFFYAALTMIPMALPLAVLLASLMTFGNLGERFELTAMKAAGVSLLRAMKPLTWLMVFIGIGAFFFQNNVLPVAQTKMWTLLYSMRQKSPEVEIPEGVFYDQIPGYNLYVDHKNNKTGVLYDLMIYNMSSGFENATTILADSGRLAFTTDKTHLYLHLWQGESFENLREVTTGAGSVPYRRESFAEKELLMPFDANFNRLDEQGMRSQYVGKNFSELRATIDSVNIIIDSLGRTFGTELRAQQHFGISQTPQPATPLPSSGIKRPEANIPEHYNIDSLFRGATSATEASYLTQAVNAAERQRQELEFKAFPLEEELKTVRRHGIELMRKFTLSFACLIFFFIGAPLGAIIRKGGLGTPLVISVFLFIVYYIIDNTGYKLARDGRWEVWQGMWLSSAILLPLGIFFTYKAVNDSAVFNADAYREFFKRLTGKHAVRHLELKTVVMDEVQTPVAVEMLHSLKARCNAFIGAHRGRQNYFAYFTTGFPKTEVADIITDVESTAEYISNSRLRLVVMKLMDLPVLRNLWIYHPGSQRWAGILLMSLFPIGLPLWLIGTNSQKGLLHEFNGIVKTCSDLETLLYSDKKDYDI